MKRANRLAVTTQFGLSLLPIFVATGLPAAATNDPADHRVFVCAHSFMIFIK